MIRVRYINILLFPLSFMLFGLALVSLFFVVIISSKVYDIHSIILLTFSMFWLFGSYISLPTELTISENKYSIKYLFGPTMSFNESEITIKHNRDWIMVKIVNHKKGIKNIIFNGSIFMTSLIKDRDRAIEEFKNHARETFK